MRAVSGRSSFPRAGPPLVVAVAYYAGCLAGFALRFPSSGISFFWPPTAVLTAALLLVAPRAWTALLASAFVAHAVAHAQDGVPIGAWPVQYIGNAAQAVLVALLVRRLSGDAPFFTDARRVLVFIGACTVAPALASLIPAYVYVNLGWAPDFSQAWRDRTVSNALASLTLLPFILNAWGYLRTSAVRMPPRAGEYALVLVGLAAAHLGIGFIHRSDVLGLSLALYAPMPLLLWAAVRFGIGGASFALLWAMLLMVTNVSAGYGPLASGTAADVVVGVQLIVALNAMLILIIGGLLAQNRAEHSALLDAERQNSAILRALPDVMLVQTRDGQYLQCFSRGEEHRWAEPFVGRRARDVLSPDLASTVMRALQRVTGDTPSVIEYTHVVNGERRCFEGRFVAIDEDRVLSVVRDITQRVQAEAALREAEQRYALATAAGGVSVWELDVQSGGVHMEGPLTDLLGYAAEDVGNYWDAWLSVIHPADRDGVHARLLLYTSGAVPAFDPECRMVHRDGSIRWVQFRGAVTDRVEGEAARVRGTCADITARKQSERSLMEANDALVRTGRIAAMAEFGASIAHELKQPLAAILANASAALRQADGSFDPDVKSALCDIVDDSRHASHIIDHTRQMLTNQPVSKAALSLNGVIRNAVDLAQARLREWKVKLELKLDGELPDVTADAIQMQQVLLNLIVNGVEAMHEAPELARRLRITSRRCRNGVVVSVSDSGNGLETPLPERLFEPFYTTKAAGVGMGLAICRSIVRNHGGTTWAVANRDGGATFRVRLPSRNREAAGRLSASPPRRVLVVDDNAAFRRSIARLLRSWGHQAAGAADPAGALALLRTFDPDFAVVDISLGEMTGIELAQELRAATPKRPLRMIALTAGGDDQLRDACYAAGFEGFLIKPNVIELERLLSIESLEGA